MSQLLQERESALCGLLAAVLPEIQMQTLYACVSV